MRNPSGKPKPFERAAGAYLHPQAWILHSEHRTTAGVLLHAPPVLRFSVPAKSAELGAAIRSTLAAYADGVPHPSSWKGSGAEFLKLTGFKSWRALEGLAKACWISAKEDKVFFTPLRNGGTCGDEKGFQPFGADPIVVSRQSADSELGEALVRAMYVSVSAA